MVSVRTKKTRVEYDSHESLIFFTDRDERSWWDTIFRTREGFRHCFLMQWCQWSNRWLMIDWRQAHLECKILFDFEAQQLMRDIGAVQGTVVRFVSPQTPIGTRAKITYCSNWIGRYLGFGNTLILTPHALYRRLRKSGGEVVFSWRDVNEKQQPQANRESEATRKPID